MVTGVTKHNYEITTKHTLLVFPFILSSGTMGTKLLLYSNGGDSRFNRLIKKSFIITSIRHREEEEH